MPHIAFIGLGSNLEDPRSQLQRAFAELGRLPDTRLLASSSLYRSAPLDCPNLADFQAQPDFVNAVAKIETALTPQALLQALLLDRASARPGTHFSQRAAHARSGFAAV